MPVDSLGLIRKAAGLGQADTVAEVSQFHSGTGYQQLGWRPGMREG